MTNLPIMFNGSYLQIVGTISLSDELLDLYSNPRTNHLVINPIIKKSPGQEIEVVVGFGVYPMPAEPEPTRKRRKKGGETEGDPA